MVTAGGRLLLAPYNAYEKQESFRIVQNYLAHKVSRAEAEKPYCGLWGFCTVIWLQRPAASARLCPSSTFLGKGWMDPAFESKHCVLTDLELV